MQRDNRDPEKLGSAILGLRDTHPQASVCERADIMEQWYKDVQTAYVNGQAQFWERTFNGKAAA